MTFNNAKQFIPEVFREKIKIDNSILFLCKTASSPEAMNSHDRFRAFRAIWNQYKETRAALRAGCEKYIQSSKKG